MNYILTQCRALFVFACLIINVTSSAISQVLSASMDSATLGPSIVKDQQQRYDPAQSSIVNAERRAKLQIKVSELAARIKQIDANRVSSNALETPLPKSTSGSTSIRKRNEVALELAAWKRAISRFDLESICGPLDNSVDVEKYNGMAGPTRGFVNLHQAPVAQLQWRNDLGARLASDGDAGNVSGERWCSGTMISQNLFLTAGHCFDVDGNGWKTPRKAGKPVAPLEMGSLMQLNFGYQIDSSTNMARDEVVFPIVKVREHRNGQLDYAIVEVGRGENNELPSSRFGFTEPDSTKLSLDSATMLTVIQHPMGLPKKIAAGFAVQVALPLIRYSDVDTLGGSSGSGVLDQRGKLIAVHTTGGCDVDGGANSGVTLNAIKEYSKFIK